MHTEEIQGGVGCAAAAHMLHVCRLPERTLPTCCIVIQYGSSQLSSKKGMDVRQAESPHQHLMAGPAALDPCRAEAASKHVRALNTQFGRRQDLLVLVVLTVVRVVVSAPNVD